MTSRANDIAGLGYCHGKQESTKPNWSGVFIARITKDELSLVVADLASQGRETGLRIAKYPERVHAPTLIACLLVSSIWTEDRLNLV